MSDTEPMVFKYFCCKCFLERLVYQMKDGSLLVRLITNTFTCDVRSYDYSAVLYSKFISLTVFLAVKQCVFVTMDGGSAVTFLLNRMVIFIKICTIQTSVKQNITLTQVCIRDIVLSL